MKDVSEWMIELVDAIKTGEHCFAIIRLYLGGTYYKLKFGVVVDDLNRLRYILTYRPFENTSVGPYRYFYSRSFQKDGHSKGVSLAGIRVEQLKQDKKFDMPLGNGFIANLEWFRNIEDKSILNPFIID